MQVYPIFLNDLPGRRCVIVGGGSEAERKVDGLLACGAEVLLVATEATPALAQHAEAGRLRWRRRKYVPGDLSGAFLAIVTETNPPETAPIYEEAERERVLINAMDDISHCTFVAGSVVERGALHLAISTSGVAPALAVRLRQRLEREIGPEYETLLELMAALRNPMARTYPLFEERRNRWYELVDSDLLDVLRERGTEAAVLRIEELTGIDLNTEARA